MSGKKKPFNAKVEVNEGNTENSSYPQLQKDDVLIYAMNTGEFYILIRPSEVKDDDPVGKYIEADVVMNFLVLPQGQIAASVFSDNPFCVGPTRVYLKNVIAKLNPDIKSINQQFAQAASEIPDTRIARTTNLAVPKKGNLIIP